MANFVVVAKLLHHHVNDASGSLISVANMGGYRMEQEPTKQNENAVLPYLRTILNVQ